MGERGDRTAVVAGAGALGGAAALTLAAGGAGRLVLVDGAPVEASDLSAQPALAAADLGVPRAVATARRLSRLFPALAVEARTEDLTPTLAAALAAGAEVVVDATNRFPLMFALNDAALAHGRPLVHGAASGLSAQLLTVVPGASGCLRCLFEGPPAAALPAAALPPLAVFAGALLGAEALRLLEGGPGAHAGLLLGFDARSARARTVAVRPRPGCPACAAWRAREAA